MLGLSPCNNRKPDGRRSSIKIFLCIISLLLSLLLSPIHGKRTNNQQGRHHHQQPQQPPPQQPPLQKPKLSNDISSQLVTWEPPNLSELQYKFQNVLVIVKHNHPIPPAQVQSHYDLLTEVFTNIVIYGPWKHEELYDLQVTRHLPVEEMSDDGGWFISGNYREYKRGCIAYRAALRAMTKAGPPPRSSTNTSKRSYDGYMVFHDDLVLNTTRLQSLDLSLPWTAYTDDGTPHVVTLTEQQWASRTSKFQWLNLDIGIPAFEAIYTQHPDIQRKVEQCTGSIRKVFIGKSDFFYLPSTEYASFIQIGEIFSSKRLFLELAIPLYMECFLSGYSRKAVKSNKNHNGTSTTRNSWHPKRLRFCDRSRPLTPKAGLESISELMGVCSEKEMIHPMKVSRSELAWLTYKRIFLGKNI